MQNDLANIQKKKRRGEGELPHLCFSLFLLFNLKKSWFLGCFRKEEWAEEKQQKVRFFSEDAELYKPCCLL